MFDGLAFAVKARKLWKRLKRLIQGQQGVPVDVIIATYLLRKEAKSVRLCVGKVLERHGEFLAGDSPGARTEQAKAIVATALGRYFQHKL